MKQETIFGYPLKQLQQEAEAIFATHAVGEKVKHKEIRDKFKSVYDRHPDKLPIDKGFDLIVFKKNLYNRKCFAIKFPNGGIFTFSLRHALKKKQSESLLKRYLELCRNIVRLDVINKKKELINLKGNICEETGELIPESQLDLHHKPPFDFKTICLSFKVEGQLKLHESLFELDHLGDTTFKDKSLIVKFRKFHKKYLKDFSGLVCRKKNRGKISKSKFIKLNNIANVTIAPARDKKSPKQLDMFDE